MSDDRHPNERLADSPDPDPVDAEATEPAERPQSRGVTRRALLGGTALGAGLLAYTSDYEDGGVTHSIARAATVPDEPLITVGPEDDPVGYIFESSGDWVFKHEASGNEFFYNSAQDRWETNQELDVPALVTEDLAYSGLAADGTIQQLWDAIVDTSNGVSASAELGQSVSTTATAIYNQTAGAASGEQSLVLVAGNNGKSAWFTDVVTYIAAGGVTVIGSAARSSPDGRTYTVDVRELDLAMAANTYNVATYGIDLRTR